MEATKEKNKDAAYVYERYGMLFLYLEDPDKAYSLLPNPAKEELEKLKTREREPEKKAEKIKPGTLESLVESTLRGLGIDVNDADEQFGWSGLPCCDGIFVDEDAKTVVYREKKAFERYVDEGPFNRRRADNIEFFGNYGKESAVAEAFKAIGLEQVYCGPDREDRDDGIVIWKLNIVN